MYHKLFTRCIQEYKIIKECWFKPKSKIYRWTSGWKEYTYLYDSKDLYTANPCIYWVFNYICVVCQERAWLDSYIIVPIFRTCVRKLLSFCVFFSVYSISFTWSVNSQNCFHSNDDDEDCCQTLKELIELLKDTQVRNAAYKLQK